MISLSKNILLILVVLTIFFLNNQARAFNLSRVKELTREMRDVNDAWDGTNRQFYRLNKNTRDSREYVPGIPQYKTTQEKNRERRAQRRKEEARQKRLAEEQRRRREDEAQRNQKRWDNRAPQRSVASEKNCCYLKSSNHPTKRNYFGTDCLGPKDMDRCIKSIQNWTRDDQDNCIKAMTTSGPRFLILNIGRAGYRSICAVKE